MRKFSFLIFFFACITSASFAQDFSNKGKDFWLGYGYHVRFVTNGAGGGAINGQDMVLYFATENIPGNFTDIKIEIPALGYVQNINNVAPGTIAESQPMPKSGTQDARLTAEGLFASGIHVTSTRSVVAYAHIYNGNVSGATLLFPTNTLGKDYYSINYKQVSNEDFSNSFFFVVAADTGVTTVQITPSAATTGGRSANVPFTVTLNQGEIYNVMGVLNGGGAPGNYTGVDLTGSRIQSVSGVDGLSCKRIAVFSGSGKMKISCGNTGSSSDNLIAQAFPKTAWGKRFLTAPTQSMPYNYYRVAVSDPATVVKLDGVIQSGIINSFYYDLPLSNLPQLIEADQPIMVAQYITTANSCGNTVIGSTGDPDMIYLSPIEQTIDEVIVNSTSHAAITQHWINVIIKTAAVASFTITGALVAPVFTLHPQDPAYSYAQISVNVGSHTLSADSGFNAIAYGYGNAESYAYNAGTNLKDLYNFIEPQNPLNISGTNSACACTPFYYTIVYPFQPLSLYWDFKGFQTPNVSVTNPISDSTYFINGKQVWRYRLPTPYTYCPAGNYPLSITAGTAGTDGCGNTQTKDDTLFVRNTPITRFNWTHNGCVTDSVRFNDISTYDVGTYSYRWTWDFGDGTFGPANSEHNPVHKYAAAGRYAVKFSLISNVGCISAVTTDTVVVTNVPVANFGISNPLCEGRAITFSDSSKVFAPGTIRKWYWNFGDGTLDTTLTNANLLHSFSVWGGKNVSLHIETNSGCASTVYNKAFTVNPNPVANFTLPAGVCLPYNSAQFTDASTIADNTQSGFSWKWKFGEPSSGARDSSVLQNPAHLYSSTGPFSIKLQVTSAAGCVDDSVKVLANIYPQPTSSFTVNAENCLNAVTSFTSTSNGQGSTVTNWYWDFGDASAQGTGVTTTHTYAASGTYQVKHWIKTNKGCPSDTITNQVIINPLPTPNFSSSTPSCRAKNITITDLSVANTGNIVQWTWDFDNGRPDSVITSVAPFTYIYDTARTYNVGLTVLTNKGCKNPAPFTKAVTIDPQPVAGFISPEVCLNDASAIFIDSSKVAAGSTITNWNWNFDDPGSGVNNTISGSNPNPQHRYNARGLYTVQLVVTTNKGCVDTLHQSFTVNGTIPIARFRTLNQLNLCANDSIAIKDSSSVDFGNVTKVEIYWDNANAPTVFELDDLPIPGKIYKHLYTNFQSPLVKVFTVRYRAYSGATCVNDIVLPVSVNAAPKVQFNAIPNICLDASPYQITQASETGGVPGPPGAAFTGAGVNVAGLFTPAFTGAGTYTIRYKYVSAFGCNDSAAQTIKVYAPAVANFGVAAPLCEKNAVTFTDSSTIPASSGTIATRKWSFGDGTADSISNNALPVNHIYNSFGAYTATLTVTTSNGCVVSKQKSITINPLPAVSFSPSDSICLPNALVQFTNTTSIADGTTNALTYAWNFGDPASGSNTSSLKNPAHLFSTTGPYNIKLTVRSGNNCSSTVTIPLTTIHPRPTANFSSDSASLCEKQTVRFTDASTGADGVVNHWQWDFGNGQNFTGKIPPPQTYNTAGSFPIALNIENSFGCKADTIRQFKVFAYPVVDAGPALTLLEGGQISINATATGNGLSYLWSPATYLSSSTVLTPVISGLSDDITYLLTVVAAGGCKDTSSVFIKVLKAPVIPNTFTPNNDGTNDYWGIQYLNSYPNCRVQVFNRYGQLLYETKNYPAYPLGWDGTYQGKPLPFGTYYYVIEPGSGRPPITGYVTIIK